MIDLILNKDFRGFDDFIITILGKGVVLTRPFYYIILLNSLTTQYIIGIGKPIMISAVLCVIVVLPVSHADARTILDIENEIDEKKELINNYETDLDSLKDELREVKQKSNTSWDALLSLDAAKQAVTDIEELIKTANEDFITLLNEKSELIIQLEEEEEKERLEQIDLRIQNRYDYSNLTKLVGVKLSKSCEIMIKSNIPNDCPDPKELIQLDSSNVMISGEFENGFRLPTQYQDSWRWYDNDDTIRIIYDPPNGMADRIKMVEISNNFGVYFTIDDMTLEDGIRKYHEGRYIENCSKAVISVNDWEFLLPDTIHTLRNNCETSEYEESKFEVMTPSIIDVSTSPNWQYQKELEQIKQDCKVICS